MPCRNLHNHDLIFKEHRFLDRVANACRVRHVAYRTEPSYCSWVKRFTLFHNKRHHRDMGPVEVGGEERWC
ncbi:MAG: phage integrase N-terminal SAM-like domain-containing protein [Planctomycetaceae bacterium]